MLHQAWNTFLESQPESILQTVRGDDGIKNSIQTRCFKREHQGAPAVFPANLQIEPPPLYTVPGHERRPNSSMPSVHGAPERWLTQGFDAIMESLNIGTTARSTILCVEVANFRTSHSPYCSHQPACILKTRQNTRMLTS